MTKSKKLLLGLVGVAAVAGIIYLLYFLLHFTFFNEYKKFISKYDVEESTEFKALSEATPSVEGMVLVAETKDLKLYLKEKDATLALYDKRNGSISYSRVLDAENDTLENGVVSPLNKNYMQSELIVSYFKKNRTEAGYNSYEFSTSLGQFEFESIENGVRILYTLGNFETITGVVPQYISEETLEDVLSRMSEEGAKFTKKKYVKSKQKGYLELLEAVMKGPADLRKLKKYFDEIDWTQDDYNREMEGSGVDFEVPEYFVIPVDYKLVDDALEVTIVSKQIHEYGGAAIHSISLLPYFGAADKDTNGYMLMPNGSGSISYFNTDKGVLTIGDDYSEYMYGIDPLAAEYTVRENTTKAAMGLYGMFFEDGHALFTTIESGSSLANVTANIGGDKTSYNNIYSIFYLRGSDTLAMFGSAGGDADLPIVEKKIYDAKIQVRFTALNGKDATYNGAANYYRNRLIAEGVLTPITDTTDVKFYYDVIGGVEKSKHILGVKYRSLYEMTTFSQAGKISDRLAGEGITNQVMNMQGWMNSGYFHDVTYNLKVCTKLGGKSGLKRMVKKVHKNGGQVYVDVAFQKVTSVSSHYAETTETSRYYGSGYIAEFGVVNPATLRQTASLGYEENQFYLISPKFLVRYVERFAGKIKGYNVDGIGLRDLASELHSDKKLTNIINREQAKQVVIGSLGKLEKTGKELLMNGAFDYTWAYATDIVDAPLKANGYYVVDQQIPFYEMLIHGCISYAGDQINMSNTTDLNDVALELIALGACPRFVFTWNESSDVKYTGMNRKYSTYYEHWEKDAVMVYNKVNEALKPVTNAFITEYQEVNGVQVITYSNGITYYVNRTAKNATANGVSVPAGSYVMGGVK